MSSEDWSDFREASKILRQERHQNWHRENFKIIRDSCLPFQSVNNGESLLFREAGKPKVDFFPSTGRWRVAGIDTTFGGGAVAFLAWYRNEKS